MAGSHPRLPTEDIYRDTERDGSPKQIVWLSLSQRQRTRGVPQAQRRDSLLILFPKGLGISHLC